MKIGLREILIFVVLAAIPLAAWWLVFRPQNRLDRKMLAEIEAKQAKLSQLNQAIAALGNLEAEIDSLDGAIKFFQSRLPNEKEIDKVLHEVWRLAEANRLATRSIRTLNRRNKSILVDESGPYAEQPISVELRGPYMGFYGFLMAMEAQPRIMRVHEMNVTKDKREGYVHTKCIMSIFFKKPQRQ